MSLIERVWPGPTFFISRAVLKITSNVLLPAEERDVSSLPETANRASELQARPTNGSAPANLAAAQTLAPWSNEPHPFPQQLHLPQYNTTIL